MTDDDSEWYLNDQNKEGETSKFHQWHQHHVHRHINLPPLMPVRQERIRGCISLMFPCSAQDRKRVRVAIGNRGRFFWREGMILSFCGMERSPILKEGKLKFTESKDNNISMSNMRCTLDASVSSLLWKISSPRTTFTVLSRVSRETKYYAFLDLRCRAEMASLTLSLQRLVIFLKLVVPRLFSRYQLRLNFDLVLSSFLPSHVFHNKSQVSITFMQHTAYTTPSFKFESLVIYPDSGGSAAGGGSDLQIWSCTFNLSSPWFLYDSCIVTTNTHAKSVPVHTKCSVYFELLQPMARWSGILYMKETLTSWRTFFILTWTPLYLLSRYIVARTKSIPICVWKIRMRAL